MYSMPMGHTGQTGQTGQSGQTNSNTANLQNRYNALTAGGAFNVNTPFQSLHDDHAMLQTHPGQVDNNAVHQRMNAMNDGSFMDSAPFALSTYQIDPREDDRVYTGTYIDPGTGVEHHSWEEAMPEKESDVSLNPSSETMERLAESFMGGINDDVRRKLGIPDYKPEDNIQIAPLSGEDGFRAHVGDWDSVRLYTEEHAQGEALRKMENNFEGIDERVGGPTGYIGLHPMLYARPQDVRAPVSAMELDDKERLMNPTSHVSAHGAWAKPTTISSKESNMNWQESGQWGHSFAMRDINQMPGDAEARAQPPRFIENPPHVNIILS